MGLGFGLGLGLGVDLVGALDVAQRCLAGGLALAAAAGVVPRRLAPHTLVRDRVRVRVRVGDSLRVSLTLTLTITLASKP